MVKPLPSVHELLHLLRLLLVFHRRVRLLSLVRCLAELLVIAVQRRLVFVLGLLVTAVNFLYFLNVRFTRLLVLTRARYGNLGIGLEIQRV